MTQLASQPWLTAAPTRAVIAALEAAGGPGCARFVGGSVRNALMGQPVDDVDIATTLRPEAAVEALAAAGLKSVPTGLEHGTVTAIAQGKPFEITTLRRDVSTDGRNATVAFTDDWAQDAARRDFRFNALYAAPDGEVFDPLGEGVADAREGRVVFVGDPETRIHEDYLRILRFFRFMAWYGKGEPDAAAVAACVALKDGMERLSAERVSKELLKLVAAPQPYPAMRLMAQTGVLEAILPEADYDDPFDNITMIETDPMLRLMALFPENEETALSVAQRLRLSNEQRDRMVGAFARGPTIFPYMTDEAARAALYAIGWRAFKDKLMLLWAQSPPSPEPLLTKFQDWRRPELPVGGADAAKAGIPKGPKVGEALRAVEAWWIAGDFQADRGATLAKLKEVAAGL